MNPGITYMLRRVLCPWNVTETIEETVQFCKKNHIDEVMWITESSGCYKELLPIEHIGEIVGNLDKAKKALIENGILFSINPMTSLGHGDYGGNLAEIHPGLELMVDCTGAKSKSCSCPLSPVWLELITETYRMYATTQPVRLWRRSRPWGWPGNMRASVL